MRNSIAFMLGNLGANLLGFYKEINKCLYQQNDKQLKRELLDELFAVLKSLQEIFYSFSFGSSGALPCGDLEDIGVKYYQNHDFDDEHVKSFVGVLRGFRSRHGTPFIIDAITQFNIERLMEKLLTLKNILSKAHNYSCDQQTFFSLQKLLVDMIDYLSEIKDFYREHFPLEKPILHALSVGLSAECKGLKDCPEHQHLANVVGLDDEALRTIRMYTTDPGDGFLVSP